MNTLLILLSKPPYNYFRLLHSVQNTTQKYGVIQPRYATTFDAIDAFTLELLQRNRSKRNTNVVTNKFSIRYFMETELKPPKDISKMTIDELDNALMHLMNKKKDKQVTEMITVCSNKEKIICDITLKKLFRNYSVAGKPEMVEILQKYCSKFDPHLYRRNGEFHHFLAKAQCMKGNSGKGLSILSECYKQNVNLRSCYRIILREVIQDSVMNRSEATLVILKKYLLEFSEKWADHYPLVCFWHICWSSSWFSDQMLSDELWESSTKLQEIVKDKAIEFSITILRQEYNEDAVLRLLQTLLKYQLMTEYVKVLEVLFSYKLRNRDLRGCSEIIKNCDVLNVTLPASLQGRYIKMLIDGKSDTKPVTMKPISKNFKLKF